MYGYNQTSYTSPFSTANAATAAAVAASYNQLQPQTGQTQAASAFGTSAATNPYSAYGANSVSAAAAYANYTQTGSAASNAYAQAAQQAQVSRLAGLTDAYASAITNPAAASYGLSAYTGSTGTAASANANYYRGTGQTATNTAAKTLSNAAKSYGGNRYNKGVSAAEVPRANSSNYWNPAGTNTNAMSTYDAAVYAAASSYIQSKATGQSNMWMSKKPNYGPGTGGKGSFPKKNYNSSGPKDAQMLVCEVCKITCAGQQTYKEHLEGQRHKKKVALAKGDQQQTLPRSKVSFRCEICAVTCTGQDTYNAHARGAKHQKALALCKKLNKPLPTEPTIIPPSEMGGTIPPPPPPPDTTGAPIPTVGGGTQGSKSRVLGISMVNFVGGSKLSTTGQLEAKKQAVIDAVGSAGTPNMDDANAALIKAQSAEVQALLAAEQSVKPVGQEYIEEERDASGKLLNYNCKLCDCKFSDPNAKEIHLKGRRHRMQYKLKVDPKLEVDPKPSNRQKMIGFGRGKRLPIGPPMMGPPVMPVPFWSTPGGHPMMFEGRRFETPDDRHVQAKHTAIYPDDVQLNEIEELVIETEKALKRVSDFFHSRDHPEKAKEVTMSEEEKKEGEKTDEQKEADKEPDRLLKGVMRVGLLSEGLLLKGDTEVRLVVLCSQIPTLPLLEEVAKLMREHYQLPEGMEMSIALDAANSCFVLKRSNLDMTCIITLTSRLYREDNDMGPTAAPGSVAPAPVAAPEPVVIPPNALNKEACLKALADLRHAKWFQARCVYLQSCQITLRILRDIRKRVASWKPLTDWMCELLVEKILTSYPNALTIGDALRRVIEAISAGLLLSSGPGILDPCEKERIDVLASLNGQQREAITSSAQHALRLIAFNQIYKVLNIERLPDVRPPLPGSFGDRKRPNEGSVNGEEVKKDKKDESMLEDEQEGQEAKDATVKMES